MITQATTTFKPINYNPSGPMPDFQTMLCEEHKIKWDNLTYTISVEGVIKEGNQWYHFNITHVHDFNSIEKNMINRELEKTIIIQKSMLKFYEQNQIAHLNDPYQ